MAYCEGELGVEGDEIGVFWRNQTGIGRRGDGANGFVVLSPCDALSVIFNGTRLSPRSFEKINFPYSRCVEMTGLAVPDRSTRSSALSSEVSNRALLSRTGREVGSLAL